MRFAGLAALLLLSCRAKPVEHVVAGRAYGVLAPKKIEDGQKLPVLVVLHAFDTSPEVQAGYFDVERTFLPGYFVVLPSGKIDADGKRFWNATDACCDQHGMKPDDVAYLDAVLDDVAARHPIDPRRVFFAGVSNGGFMAQRYACDRAARVRGFASVSGGLWEDLTRCRPLNAVAALLVHGDQDDIVRYDGGGSLTGTAARYPAARDAARFWAERAGASADSTANEVRTWTGGEAPVELWTVPGAGHRIARSAQVAQRVADFFDKLR